MGFLKQNPQPYQSGGNPTSDALRMMGGAKQGKPTTGGPGTAPAPTSMPSVQATGGQSPDSPFVRGGRMDPFKPVNPTSPGQSPDSPFARGGRMDSTRVPNMPVNQNRAVGGKGGGAPIQQFRGVGGKGGGSRPNQYGRSQRYGGLQ